MLVGGVVVEDDVDHLAGRHRALDRVEEPDELLMSMARHALADDRAVEHIEGGEQGGGAVALVIEGHRAGLALLDGQARLGAIECLDLMGWMAPSRHRRAKLVAVEQHQGEPSRWRLQRLASIWPSTSSRSTA